VKTLHTAWVLVLALALFETRAADWPRLGGPNGSYISSENGLARAWPTNGPRSLWSVEVGKGFAGPAVYAGWVYLLDRPDSKQDVLRCLSLADGREEWRLAYEAPGMMTSNSGSRNVPTVDEQYIFAAGPFGQFHCVDRQRHTVVWAKHLVNDFKDPEIDRAEAPADRADQLDRAQVPAWGLTQAPLLYRDLVIVAPQTKKVGLVAYERTTGKIRWQSGYLGRNWYSHISPTLMRLGGVEQVIMLAQPSDPEKSPAKAPPAIISGTDIATGRILWTTKTPGPHKIPIAQPLQIGNDRLFITGGYGLGSLMLQVTLETNQWTTKILFRNQAVAAHIHSPVLYQDHIYVSSIKEQGASQTGLVCLELEGRALWQTGPALQLFDGALLFADGLALAMNGKNGRLSLLGISPAGFKSLAEARVLEGSNIWAPMALSDGRLLVRDEGQLKCLDLRQP
jgi:outer membrane protein assembly factor BamB